MGGASCPDGETHDALVVARSIGRFGREKHLVVGWRASLDYMWEGHWRWEGIKETNSDCDRDPPCPDVGAMS